MDYADLVDINYTLRMPRAVYNLIKSRAQARGLTMAEWLRRAGVEYQPKRAGASAKPLRLKRSDGLAAMTLDELQAYGRKWTEFPDRIARYEHELECRGIAIDYTDHAFVKLENGDNEPVPNPGDVLGANGA